MDQKLNNKNLEEQERENKMGREPILPLLVSMSLPAIISMMVQAAYNVVDSIYVSRIGEEALAAVSLVFPIQIIIVALSVGMGVGINSGISRSLGSKHEEKAVLIAENGLILGVLTSLICIFLALTVVTPYISMFTDNSQTLKYAIQYSQIVTILAFGGILTQAGFSIMQGTGNMIQPMIGQLIGAIINIILDPIFIFGYFGLPKFEVAGAAIATVIGQIVSMIYILGIVFFRKKNILKVKFNQFRFRWPIFKEIISVGLPSAVMQGIGSVMLTGYNYLLASYGTTVLAVFGVYFKVQSFIFMPVFGLNQGAMPIYGYNFGARNEKRFMDTLKISMLIAIGIMTIGMLIFEFFPDTVLKIFDASDDLLKIGEVCLRTIAYSYPVAAIGITISNSFQAMGKAYISMIASILRQIVFLLPAAFILLVLFGLDANWYSFLIAEGASLAYLLIVFMHTKRTVLDKFPK